MLLLATLVYETCNIFVANCATKARQRQERFQHVQFPQSEGANMIQSLCDVERSFNRYNSVLRDNRQTFDLKNLRRYFIVHCYDDN